jgi:multiple antibiotic resistance protein
MLPMNLPLDFAHRFLLCFIPVLVALDPVVVLPLFLGMTEKLGEPERRRVARNACLTGLAVSFGFLAIGNAVFRILGIRLCDFLVAGGILLFCLCLMDLYLPDRRRHAHGEEVGAVPLGTPLLVGPGTLTTSLLLVGQFGIVPTAAALAAALALSWALLLSASWLLRLLGDSGVRVGSRIAALLMAAYAIMMVRKGVLEMLRDLSAGIPG